MPLRSGRRKLTVQQKDTMRLLESRFGIASWKWQPHSEVLVFLNNGDCVVITAMGNWELV